MAGELLLRNGLPTDAEPCAKICYEAFNGIAKEHNFPTEMPSKDLASKALSFMLTHPSFYSVIAEKDGAIIGSNFLDCRDRIAGVGPLTIEPDKQNSGVGRSLMQAVVDHALEQNFQGIRLIAATFHNRAFGLYTKLGFDVREQLAVLHGSPIAEEIPECHVRQAAVSDLEECNKLCFRIHGFDRGGELNDSINRGKAVVVGREGRISGYSTGVTFIGHSIAETNQDLKALIGAAPSLSTGFLIPVSNSEVLRWCLDKGLQISRPMTLMSLGTYNEPTGPFLPSLLY